MEFGNQKEKRKQGLRTPKKKRFTVATNASTADG